MQLSLCVMQFALLWDLCQNFPIHPFATNYMQNGIIFIRFEKTWKIMLSLSGLRNTIHEMVCRPSKCFQESRLHVIPDVVIVKFSNKCWLADLNITNCFNNLTNWAQEHTTASMILRWFFNPKKIICQIILINLLSYILSKNKETNFCLSLVFLC